MVTYQSILFVLMRNPRWPQPQDKFIIGPYWNFFFNYSYRKPMNHLKTFW